MAKQKYEYKQVYVRPEKVEDKANELAEDGWQVHTIMPPNDSGQLGELAIVFERPV